MITTLLPALKARLAHPTEGVNALLTRVPNPTNVPLRPITQIVTSLEHSSIARGQLDDALLAAPHASLLAIHEVGDAEAPGRAVSPDLLGSFTVAIRFALRESVAKDAAAIGALVLRCVHRCLVQWVEQSGAQDQVLTFEQLDLHPPQIRLLPIAMDQQDPRIVRSCIASFPVLDRWALAPTLP